MSTRVEAPPIGGSFAGPILIAIVVALVVGVLMGTVVTKVVNDPLAASSGVAPARPLVVTPLGALSWDSQKLEAMEGRALAERYRSEAGAAVPMDTGKLEETEAHQLAEQFRSEAMEDRQLAEDVHRHRPVGGPLG
jgi:hypothetical protein